MQHGDSDSCQTALAEVRTCNPVISRELVDAAFGYQKEILELRHKNAVHPKIQREKTLVEQENISLKKRRSSSAGLIQELEVKVSNAQARNQADQNRLKELMELAFSLLRPTSMVNQPIPQDIMLQCRQVIDAADGRPAMTDSDIGTTSTQTDVN